MFVRYRDKILTLENKVGMLLSRISCYGNSLTLRIRANQASHMSAQSLSNSEIKQVVKGRPWCC